MKYVKYLFCGFFIAILFFFLVTTVNNNKEISELEKRTLQTFPKFSVESVMSGEYMEQLTTAFSDQLEFRDLLIKGYFLFQFQKYNGDVVIGENNELYAAYQKTDDLEATKGYLKDAIEEVNEVAGELDAKFIFLSIPRKDAVETENLPDSYIDSSKLYEECMGVVRDTLDSDITLIDGYEIFKNDNHARRYFYMTDHHITPAGSELLYKEILASLKDDRIPLYDLSNYEVGETIINGSFNNQIGQSVKTSPEELYILPKFELEYERFEDESPSDLTIYAEANTYEDAYMEGDYAYTIVDTGREELPNILYVGSSFTNILEAMSVPSFNQMVSIDYRHNTSGNSIKYYVEKHDIDYVVFVPSQSNNALSPIKIKEHLGL